MYAITLPERTDNGFISHKTRFKFSSLQMYTNILY